MWIRRFSAAPTRSPGQDAWPSPGEDLEILAHDWNVYEPPAPAGRTRLFLGPLVRLVGRLLRRIQAPALVQQARWNRAVTALLAPVIGESALRHAGRSDVEAWPSERLRACEERLVALERELSALHAELADRGGQPRRTGT